MRFAVIGTGSRGDSTPMLALAVALARRGHEVRFLTLEEYRGASERWGLDVRTLPGASAAFFGGPAGVAMRTALTRGPRAYLRFFDTYMRRFLTEQLLACTAACDGVDVIITWPWLRVGTNVARLLGVSCIIASPTPPLYLSTRAFACPYTRPPDDEGKDVEGSWADAEACFAAGQAAIEQWRDAVGLPSISVAEELAEQRKLPHLLGISPVLLPKPDDWDDSVEMFGAYELPRASHDQPPDNLAAFLDRGAPPVGVGFSSSVARDPRRSWTVIAEAIERAEVRAVLVGGYAELPDLSQRSEVFCVSEVPYTWLLPRLAGLVHHGGLGTTHVCIAAGCPQQIVPFGWDQPHWGRRVHDLGVGPPPLPGDTLEVDALVRGLRSLANEAAWRVGTQAARNLMQRDGGAPAAAARIEQLV